MSVHGLKLAPQDCGDCPIRHRAVCSRCDGPELARLEEMKYYRSFEAGQNVVWSGDRISTVKITLPGITLRLFGNTFTCPTAPTAPG